MKILGIETSCDETSASVVEDGVRILSNVVVSQIDIFAKYGGVIPEVSARSHLEAILPVIDKSIEDANLTWNDIDAIAVTHTPGLLGSLLVGTLTARTLAILHKKPLYPVHHLKSHIYANWLEKRVSSSSQPIFDQIKTATFPRGRKVPAEPVEKGLWVWGAHTLSQHEAEHLRENMVGKKEQKPSFPLLALVISGGHTQILYMKKHNDFEIIGTTLDDAVGECFDKVAKILGLPYPGGPSISKSAKSGDRNKYHFPHPKTENPLDFSFSGLKTAVLRAVQKELNLPISHPSYDLKNHLTEQQIADFSASFEQTAIDILLEKLALAHEKYPEIKSIVFAGGVSANNQLRKTAFKPPQNISFSEHVLNPLIPQHFPHPNKNVAGVSRTAFARIERNMLWNLQGEQKPAKKKTMSGENKICTIKASRTNSQTSAEHSREYMVGKKTPNIFFPDPSLSGDNGAMVASACFYEIKSGVKPTDPYSLDIFPRSPIK